MQRLFTRLAVVSTDGTVRVEFEREWKTRYVRGSQTSRLRLEASARQRV